MGLEDGEAVWLLGEHQPGLGGVAALQRMLVEEFAVPDLFLGLPVHNVALLDGPPEGNLAEIPAFLQLGCHIDFLMPISGKTIWYDAGSIGLSGRHEAGFDGVCAIVEDESGAWWWRPRSS